MPTSPYAAFEEPIRADLLDATRDVLQRIAAPGSWWSGAQRLAVARVARRARAQRATPLWLRDAVADEEALPAAAMEVARRVALEAHQLDREWCGRMVAELGDAAYVELVAVVVCTTAIDAFAEALGVAPEPLLEPRSGDPDRVRPDGSADVGAWLPMTEAWAGPNVGRALSLAPADNQLFMRLVGSMYAVADFFEMVWKRPLSRPQVELVAARVSALNECFY